MIRAELQYELWMGGPITLFFLLFFVSLIMDDDYLILWDRWNIQFHVSLCRFFCQFNFYGFY